MVDFGAVFPLTKQPDFSFLIRKTGLLMYCKYTKLSADFLRLVFQMWVLNGHFPFLRVSQ